MAPDRLTPSERKARRERVRRRQAWAKATQTDAVLTLGAHDRTIRMHAAEGKIPACWRAGKPYEQPLLEHIYGEGFTGLAVDAGANIGNHTLWFAGICGLDVVAFEPIKWRELVRNVALNDLQPTVRVEPAALGAETASALHVGKGRLSPGRGALPVRRLDDYGLSGVSLIKADVEGMEASVLAGGERTIRRDQPVIFTETWTDKERRAVAAVVEPWGYQATRAFSGKGSPTPMVRWDPRRKAAR